MLSLLLSVWKDLIVMSVELESINQYQSINYYEWSEYPSLKPLLSWIDDFLLRLQFIEDWIDYDVSNICWIFIFIFTSISTSSLQNFTHKYKISIDIVV